MADKKRILIIDDEEDVKEMLRMRLANESFDVLLANDGDIGIEIAKQKVPDLIILDIMMPKMDGYTCLKELRRIPKTKDISILMLSGKEEDKVKDLFTFQRISGYIEKPFNLDHLVSKVKEILEV